MAFLGRLTSHRLWFLAGVAVLVGGLGVAVFHSVASRQVLGFDCGSPMDPTEFAVDATGLDQLHAVQCDHELDQAHDARAEALALTTVTVAIGWMVTVLDRGDARRKAAKGESDAAGDEPDAQAEREP